MTASTDKTLETVCTEVQLAAVKRMQSAPAMKWTATRTLSVTSLGVKHEGVAVQMEAPQAKIWGLVLPDGSFLKPQAGRKTIDATAIAARMPS